MDLRDIRLSEPFRSWYLNGLQYFFRTRPDSQEGDWSRQVEPTNTVSPEKKFPSPWYELWACSSPPCLSVWTYWDLGDDCSKLPDQDRQLLFDNILTALELTRQDVLFWPLISASKGESEPQEAIFWQGVELSGAKYVVCFGEKVFRGLFPKRSPNYTSFVYKGYEVILVPGPDEMLPDNRKAKQIAWHLLKKTIKKDHS